MKNSPQKKTHDKNDTRISLVVALILVIALIISGHVWATDLLAGTDTDIKETMRGTGKNWIYLIDGGISIASFVYSKKVFVFFSVLGVAIFITVLIKLAGG